MKKTILLLILCCLLGSISQAQITRGASPGEIYITTDWYINNGGIHYAILHSKDNGKNISKEYENILTAPPGEMKVGLVIGDATPGALYNFGWNELWVSFNYGVNWEYREDFPSYTAYFSGEFEGVIYKGKDLLYKSNNYAQTYEVIPNFPVCPISEVGSLNGEFYGIDGNEEEGFFIYHSFDYDSNFTKIHIDTTIVSKLQYRYPKISRGAEPGELYLVSWGLPEEPYKIFYSNNSGYTWTEKYESDNSEYMTFTAGREPGAFYILRCKFNPSCDHIMLYINYSSDYGETFTTYFHDLDSTYTSVKQIKKTDFKLSAFPNPFSDKTTIKFKLTGDYKNTILKIFNISGKLIREFNITAKKSQQWDGTDNNGNLVKEGIYLYNINYNNISSKLNKILFFN